MLFYLRFFFLLRINQNEFWSNKCKQQNQAIHIKTKSRKKKFVTEQKPQTNWHLSYYCGKYLTDPPYGFIVAIVICRIVCFVFLLLLLLYLLRLSCRFVKLHKIQCEIVVYELECECVFHTWYTWHTKKLFWKGKNVVWFLSEGL